MRLRELVEDARADIETRDFITTACQTVMGKLHRGAQPDKAFNMGGTKLFAYFPETLGLGNLIPNYLFCLAVQEHHEMTARVGPLGQTVMGRYDHVLVMDCLHTFELDSIPRSQTNAFFSTLKHELTHVTDFIRTDSKINSSALDPNDRSEAGMAAYYNDDAELNAYYHDITDRLTQIGRDLKTVQTHTEAIQLLDQNDFIGSFKNDLHELLSGTDSQRQAFLAWISDGNRKKLLRRLYLLHVEIMKQVNALP